MKNLRHVKLLSNLKKLLLKDILFFSLEGILVVIILGYFFFRSVVITAILLPFSFLFVLYKSENMQRKRKLELQTAFKDVLVSVNGSLRAGYSLENAFLEAEKEMQIFHGEKSQIVKELKILKLGLRNGKSLQQALFEMGKRSEVTSIQDFAAILIIGKQTGGKLTDIVDSFIHIEEDKVQVEQEIETMISSKRFEQKIMNCVPFFIIFYIEITSKGFFDVLYNNILGRSVMIICLIIYIFSIYLSERIIDIKI